MATLDVVSYERARQALSIGPADSSRRDLFEAAITAVSQRMDEVCGPIVQRTITEIVEVDRPMTTIRLSTGPVSSITSVTAYVTGTGAALTAETLVAAGGYLPEFEDRIRPDGTSQLLSGVIRRRLAYGDSWWDWPSRVQVVYVAGRYANTAAAADSRFEQAALIALRSLWRTYQSQVAAAADGDYAAPFQAFPSVAIPAAALELVAADRVHVVGMA
jgi:hypothetical protein